MKELRIERVELLNYERNYVKAILVGGKWYFKFCDVLSCMGVGRTGTTYRKQAVNIAHILKVGNSAFPTGYKDSGNTFAYYIDVEGIGIVANSFNKHQAKEFLSWIWDAERALKGNATEIIDRRFEDDLVSKLIEPDTLERILEAVKKDRERSVLLEKEIGRVSSERDTMAAMIKDQSSELESLREMSNNMKRVLGVAM